MCSSISSSLENLKGKTLFLDRSEVEQLLAVARTRDDGFGADGERVAEELVALGVLSIRRDGRFDVPDLYRYGFGIRRKGGVRRPR